jgi:hypothetical protein
MIIFYTMYRMSNTDTTLVGVLGGLYVSFAGFCSVYLGLKVIESVDNKINPRTPEYLAKQKKATCFVD